MPIFDVLILWALFTFCFAKIIIFESWDSLYVVAVGEYHTRWKMEALMEVMVEDESSFGVSMESYFYK